MRKIIVRRVTKKFGILSGIRNLEKKSINQKFYNFSDLRYPENFADLLVINESYDSFITNIKKFIYFCVFSDSHRH